MLILTLHAIYKDSWYDADIYQAIYSVVSFIDWTIFLAYQNQALWYIYYNASFASVAIVYSWSSLCIELLKVRKIHHN